MVMSDVKNRKHASTEWAIRDCYVHLHINCAVLTIAAQWAIHEKEAGDRCTVYPHLSINGVPLSTIIIWGFGPHPSATAVFELHLPINRAMVHN